MRAYLQGGYFVVEIDPEEVEAFASTWPGSNMTTTAGKDGTSSYEVDGSANRVDPFAVRS